MPIFPEGISSRLHVGRPTYWLRRFYLRLRKQGLLQDHNNQRRLQAFHNIHRGQRCFIIGNGPSLQHTDLSLLASEITFGMNRFYLKFPELDFEPTYYVAVNLHVLEQFSAALAQLSMPCFVPWYAYPFIKTSPQMHFLDFHEGLDFATDIRAGLWTGVTVTYVALQLAYYMGFQEVYLIGVDHYFKTQGKAHELITAQAPDQEHFHPDYFGVGVRWQLPDLQGSEENYALAKTVYERNQRQVFDATVDGHLQIFPKIAYDTLFES